MEVYTQAAFAASRQFLNHYSSSFGLASRLFGKSERQHIANVYALVRLADEIVDTYSGPGAGPLLNELEQTVSQSLARGYSTNPIVHAFIVTANAFAITDELVQPFFNSMRTDLQPPRHFSQRQYETYIFGSAEVVGLMCLHIFCAGDTVRYKKLLPGARALGSAFQKVNFLRDMAADHELLGRYYFPIGSFADFDESIKTQVVHDIWHDLSVARPAVRALSRRQRRAVGAAYNSYAILLKRLNNEPVATIKRHRLRITTGHKLWLLLRACVGSYVVIPKASE